jgi:hypothetical protein
MKLEWTVAIFGIVFLIAFFSIIYFYPQTEKIISPISNTTYTTFIIYDAKKLPAGLEPSPQLEFEGASFGYKYNIFRHQFELYQEVIK